MKGIILAGGSGTRLYPATRIISKQLLDIGGKPMIYYPLTLLLMAGIRDILIISSPEHIDLYQHCLANSPQWGINLHYTVQSHPGGLAQAFLIPKQNNFTSSEEFIANEPVTLILGDNIFFGPVDFLQSIQSFESGALIYAKHIVNPERFGVVQFNSQDLPIALVEKPQNFISHWAVTGLYVYDSTVIERAAKLKPSARGELEITDLNRSYMETQELKAVKLRRAISWFDTGTKESIELVRQFIYLQEKIQEILIGAPEEIAYRMGFIDSFQFQSIISHYPDNEYRRLLEMVHPE